MPLPSPKTAHPIHLPDGTAHRNIAYLKAVIDHPRMVIGDYSYASRFDEPKDWAAILAPYLFPFSHDTLTIGRFAQIAHGATFITSGAMHPMSGFSTYPFRIFDPKTMMDYTDLPYKDIVVDHDVWIGYEAIIMPGVHIGSGAIIATRAVVTHDVAPFTIVGGNPAQPIRQRFSDEVIADLLDIAWWDWPIDKINAHQTTIESADLEGLRAR
jgi:virginiamycin A acetyltransferase